MTFDGLYAALGGGGGAPRSSARPGGDGCASVNAAAAGELRALPAVAGVLASLGSPPAVPPPPPPAGADGDDGGGDAAVAAAAASAAAATAATDSAAATLSAAVRGGAAAAAAAAACGRALDVHLAPAAASVRLVKGAGATLTPAATAVRRTRAHTAVSTLLATAGALFRRHATTGGVALSANAPARWRWPHAVVPPLLRRYADLGTQRQLKALLLASTSSALRRSPLGRRHLAALRMWLDQRRAESVRLVGERRCAALYDTFAGACEAQVAAVGRRGGARR